MQEREQIAAAISREMRAVAEPDSHFHLDFSQFIPGFVGSAAAAARLADFACYREAKQVFVTPDNGLLPLRRRLLEEGRDIVLPSYGLHRGFILIEAAAVPPGQALFASWLDGVDHFGRPVSLAELKARGPFDLIVAGASAVTLAGLRFGMGAHYLDVEWGIFAETGLAGADTTVAALVHDLQVVDADLPIRPTDVLADRIVTPTRTLNVPVAARPAGLDWSLVDDCGLSDAPPLIELSAGAV